MQTIGGNSRGTAPDRTGNLDQEAHKYESTGARGPTTSGAANTDKFDTTPRSGAGAGVTAPPTVEQDDSHRKGTGGIGGIVSIALLIAVFVSFAASDKTATQETLADARVPPLARHDRPRIHCQPISNCRGSIQRLARSIPDQHFWPCGQHRPDWPRGYDRAQPRRPGSVEEPGY